mgnify:CR=1 FL=1
MATLSEIFQALADQLDNNISMWEGWELHVEPSPFPIAESPNINMLITSATGNDEGLAGFGQVQGGIPIAITFRVPSEDMTAAVEMALAFMDSDGDLSILAALDADRTLGGVVDSIAWGDGFPWTGFTDFPQVNGDGVLLGSRLNITVLESFS